MRPYSIAGKKYTLLHTYRLLAAKESKRGIAGRCSLAVEGWGELCWMVGLENHFIALKNPS